MVYHNGYLYVKLKGKQYPVWSKNEDGSDPVAYMGNNKFKKLSSFTRAEKAENPDIEDWSSVLPDEMEPNSEITESNGFRVTRITTPGGRIKTIVQSKDEKDLPRDFRDCLKSAKNADYCRKLIGAVHPGVALRAGEVMRKCKKCAAAGLPICVHGIDDNGIPGVKKEIPILSYVVVENGQILGGYNSKMDKMALKAPISITSSGLPRNLVIQGPAHDALLPLVKEASRTTEAGKKSAGGVWVLGEEFNMKIQKQIDQALRIPPLCKAAYYFDDVTKSCFLIADRPEEKLKMEVRRKEQDMKQIRLIVEYSPKSDGGFGASSTEGWIIGAASKDPSTSVYIFTTPAPVTFAKRIPRDLILAVADESISSTFAKLRQGQEAAYTVKINGQDRQLTLSSPAKKLELLLSAQEEAGELIQVPPGCAEDQLFADGKCRHIRSLQHKYIQNAKEEGELPQGARTLLITANEQGDRQIEAYWNEKGYYVVPTVPITIASESDWRLNYQLKLGPLSLKQLQERAELARHQEPGTKVGNVVTTRPEIAASEIDILNEASR